MDILELIIDIIWHIGAIGGLVLAVFQGIKQRKYNNITTQLKQTAEKQNIISEVSEEMKSRIEEKPITITKRIVTLELEPEEVKALIVAIETSGRINTVQDIYTALKEAVE